MSHPPSITMFLANLSACLKPVAFYNTMQTILCGDFNIPSNNKLSGFWMSWLNKVLPNLLTLQLEVTTSWSGVC